MNRYKILFPVLLLIAALLGNNNVFGQPVSKKDKDFNPPQWVKMMEDPNTNYFAAIKEYERFWKGKEKPADEEQEMNKGTETANGHIGPVSKREIKEARLQDYYRYQCKRFENWKRENKPFVQKDGRILSAEERVKLWEQEQKERQ